MSMRSPRSPRSLRSSLAPRWLYAVLLALVVGAVGSCGVGDVQETPFVYGMMGPEGGTATVGAITLTIPPGALTQPTAISVFPETTVLPIAPPAGDLATYELVQGFQWCCGPSGMALLLDAVLTVGYAQVITPAADVTDENVVLLLWDHTQNALVPANVGHQPDDDLFTDPHYRRMGHVALGVRVSEPPPPPPEFTFIGYVQEQRIDAQVGTEAIDGPITSGLYIASADDTTPLLHLATDEGTPQTCIASPDGEQILFEIRDYYQGEYYYDDRTLYAVTKDDLVPTLLAGEMERIEGSDPLFGWMRDGLRAFCQVRLSGDGLDGDGIGEDHAFATMPRDGTGPVSYLYEMGPYAFANDARQSPDGELVLISYYGGDESEQIDVFDADTGDPVSQDLIPNSGTWVTPRFLPDSTGVYLVDSDQESVQRYAPDGTGPTLLFQPPAEHGYLKEFVLAPNGDDFAYITAVPQGDVTDVSQVAAVVPGNDALHVGSLSEGVRASVDLGGMQYGYAEFIFHPSGAYVYVDSWNSDVRVFAAADGTESPALPIQGVSDMDISRVDGRLLVVVSGRKGSAPVLVGPDGPTSEFGPAGVYVCEPDGSEATLVALPEELVVGAARWLRSTRLAPCMNGVDLFR